MFRRNVGEAIPFRLSVSDFGCAGRTGLVMMPAMRSFLRSFLVVAIVALAASVHAEETELAPLSRVLFGSCIKQENPVPIFDAILDCHPELFLFLGDNIYADTSDMAVMREKYEKLGVMPGFRKLQKTCPVMATWDDHDYGLNDGGAGYEKRDDAQKVFLDFWQDPQDSPRRKRPGVYEARTFGPEGKRVQVILLDARYFRGPLKKGEKRTGGSYYPDDDPSIPMLGEEQWKWLEEQFRKPAELRLVGTGIQLVAEAAGQETWSNLPRERQRFFDLVAKTNANGVIVLSGDRHWAELSCAKEGVPYPIYDLTSSSLNQIHPRGTPTDNRFRAIETTWHKENFGEVEIDWEKSNVHLRVRDEIGKVRLEQTVSLSELAK